MYKKLFSLVFTLSFLAACHTPGSSIAALSGVYQGMLPCADCMGIETTLTLRPDGTFTLRRQYQKDEVFTAPLETGTWQRNDKVIELFSRAPTPVDERQCFGLMDSGALVQFDVECAPYEGVKGVLEKVTVSAGY
jgi:uncharacterized lipoprotein NlpE involved in copper resistance